MREFCVIPKTRNSRCFSKHAMRIALLILSIALSLPGISQTVALENFRENILHPCIDNELHIVCNKYKAASLILECPDLDIIPDTLKGTGYFIVRVKPTTKIATLKVKAKTPAGKMIVVSSQTFRVNNWYTISYGGNTGDVLIINKLRKAHEVSVATGDHRFAVLSYSVSIMHDSMIIYRGINNGPILSDSITKQFRLLKDRDILLFSEIRINACDSIKKAGVLSFQICDPKNPR